jgi:hypothetical protein
VGLIYWGLIGKGELLGNGRRKLWKRVSLSVGEHGGIRLLGILIDRCRGALEREHLSLWELC